MKKFKVVCFAFLLLPFFVLSQRNFTTIPDTDGGPTYVFANEGDENVEIFCEVHLNAVQIVTDWSLMRQTDNTLIGPTFDENGTVIMPIDLIGKITAIGELLTPTLSYQTNFTIINFTREFDNSTILCGPQAEQRTFTVGFSVIPLLNLTVPIQTETEGNDITVPLSVPGAAPPFPPLLSSLWTHEGVPLSPGINITLDTFTITLTNVQRNQSGNYTLTVSNGAGSATTSFILDVQFGVGGTPVGGDRLVVTGSTVTLVGFANATGNPLPAVTWSGPDGQPRTNGSRFTLIDGQLTITDITNDDNGTYTATLSNGIGSSLVSTIELTVAVPPGAPGNVSQMDVTDTMVMLSWLPPSETGTPPFNYYQVTMTPPPPSDVILNTTNTSLLVWGIIPNTMYNVSVRAVIADDRIGQLAGPSSQPISFMTLVGAPMFEDVSVANTDGNIVVSWVFRHTGGQEIDDISITCDSDNDTRQLMDMLMCTDMSLCVDDNLMGSTSVGPVLAGITYDCSITASNGNGTDTRNITDITPLQGIPSAPVLVDTLTEPGRVTFILRTSSAGDNVTFQFIVNINNTVAQMTTSQSFNISNYISNSNASITVILNDGGSYIFTITTSNRFGQSSVTVDTPRLMIEPVSSVSHTPTYTTTITTTTTTAGPSTTVMSSTMTTTVSTPSMSTVTPSVSTPPPTIEGEPLGGGAIAGIIIGVIILGAIIILVILIFVYIYYRNKGGSYQVERGGGGGKGVKVEELDIDIGTELKDTSGATPSNGGGQGKKEELHYADLEHFRKPSPTEKKEVPEETEETVVKPNPIEEVQYAQIQAQSAT